MTVEDVGKVLVVAVGSLLAQEAPGIRGVVRELCPNGGSHEDVRISGTKCTDGDGTGFQWSPVQKDKATAEVD